MKRQYVNTLQEGDSVNDYFVAARKDLRPRQNGGLFLGLVFKDKTGDIGGVVWNNAPAVANLFETGDVVTVKGRVQTYQGRLQMHVEQILPMNDGDYALSDLVNSAGNEAETLGKFRAILDTVENPHLKALNAAFLDDGDFVGLFAQAAAAKGWHHEYRGGLLHHCYEMARVAETMCELYPNIDRDLLLTGVLLHDLGKLHELRHGLAVEYTTPGRLVGHIYMGARMAEARMDAIEGFPETLRTQVLHLILSHHGEQEHGSPVVPMTLEAIVLHHIDNLDAQAAAFTRIVEKTKERNQPWSDYQPLISRSVWTRTEEL